MRVIEFEKSIGIEYCEKIRQNILPVWRKYFKSIIDKAYHWQRHQISDINNPDNSYYYYTENTLLALLLPIGGYPANNVVKAKNVKTEAKASTLKAKAISPKAKDKAFMHTTRAENKIRSTCNSLTA